MKILTWITLLIFTASANFNLDEVSEVEIAEGHTVNVEITSTPSTGYLWRLIADDSFKLFTHDLYGDFIPDESGRPGAPGKQVFYLKATRGAVAGDVINMKMVLQRPWEQIPVETKEFKVTIIS